MLKSIPFKPILLVPVIMFCLISSGFSKGPCPPDCPQNLSTTQEDVEFLQSWHFEWDPNNPHKMNRDSSIEVKVIGGEGPFTWAVSGTGFSLNDSETQGRSNFLFADGTACGSAKITVNDSKNRPQAVGSVRTEAHGQWVTVSYTCGLSGAPDLPYTTIPGNGYTATRTVGGQRQTETITAVSGGRTCDASCSPADCDCNNPQYTANGGGCEPCLSLPPLFKNTSYNCRYSKYDHPLFEGTFYCYDYTVHQCRSDVFGYCGGSVPANAYRCYASSYQEYEQYVCNN